MLLDCVVGGRYDLLRIFGPFRFIGGGFVGLPWWILIFWWWSLSFQD